MCFFILKFILFLCVERWILIDVLFHHANRGTSCLAEIPTLGNSGDVQIVMELKVMVGGLLEVERNL
jgi:hypothetical protein